jgi:hypothetical protein
LFSIEEKGPQLEYVDPKIVKGFRSEVTQQLAESVDFAVQQLEHSGEVVEADAIRQTAQDALSELMTPMVEATIDAYKKSEQFVDFDAVAQLFNHLAIRARLMALCARDSSHPDRFPTVLAKTRRGDVEGTLYDVLLKDNMETAHIGDEYIPVVAILEIKSES